MKRTTSHREIQQSKKGGFMSKVGSPKAFLSVMFMLSVLFVLSGCGEGLYGGGHWNEPPGPAPTPLTAPVVTATVPATTIPGPTPDVPINTEVTVAFDQDMDPATITAPGTFTLTGPGTTPVAGTVPAVTYDVTSRTATFRPAAALTPGVTYSARINTAARNLAGTALASDYVWTFTTSLTPDTTRPTVLSTVPATTFPGPTPAVPTNTTITAVFSEDIAPARIVAPGAFTVTGPGTTPVIGASTAVIYDVTSRTATFRPAAALAPNVTYTVTIKGVGSAAVTDVAGNALAGNPAQPLLAGDYVWQFTTSAAPDTIRPRVISTIPATTVPGPTAAGTNTAISATFNENMLPATITAPGAFTVTGPGSTAVPAGVPAVTYDVASRTATFHPSAALASGTYTARIKGVGTSAVTDAAGNALAGNPSLPLAANDYVFTFAVSPAPDSTRPQVTSTVPATTVPGPTPSAASTAIRATFNENMLPATITAPGAFTVTGPGTTPVPAAVPAVTYDAASRTAIFHPAAALTPGTTYTATIKGVGTSAVTDAAGNALAGNSALPLAANDYVWQFSITPTPVPHLGPAPVDLGRAGTFRVLAGSAITNTDIVTNRTRINGNAGVSPGSTVNGLTELNNIVSPFQLFAGVPTAADAKTDLLIAYNDAASRSTAAISLPGQLGGLTLAPGLYVNSTSSGISGPGPQAILTLDGGGDPTAVWIFQMGSTLITDPTTSIVCTNGCNAENIFWQVGSSATLGVNSIFYGTIMADASITLNTGAVLHGRALTRSGAATMDTNQIVP